jgi:alpha-beta hydrolase superfamily lysophospholipase
MNDSEIDLIASDGKKIHICRWLPASSPQAIVHIIHGMAEHAQRYEAFAHFLNHHGFAVIAPDLRGHGKTAGSLEERGYFADKDGWMRVTTDIHELNMKIKQEYPGKPIFMLGHSMGSFLTRTYMALYGNEIRGCVLSGTATHPPVLLFAADIIASIQMSLLGKRHPGKLLDNLSFGAYNKRIKDPRSRFDWLSHDAAIVDSYLADPYCGFVCSAGFFHDLFIGLKFINSRKNISKTPVDLPLLFIAGAEDPVGNYTRSMLEAVHRFKIAGVKDIEVMIYEDGRHEMLNEIGKEVVYNDILRWLQMKAR